MSAGGGAGGICLHISLSWNIPIKFISLFQNMMTNSDDLFGFDPYSADPPALAYQPSSSRGPPEHTISDDCM